MMQAVRGIYRGGIVELLETPTFVDEAEVVVTFLTGAARSVGEDDAGARQAFEESAPPLDDFEPFVPAKPGLLSDIVLEGRG